MRYFDVHRHYHVTPEDSLDSYMSQAGALGVEKVGMSTCGPLFNQYDNEGVLEAMRRYPDEMVGFGYVRLGLDGPQKVDELYALGFRALKVIVPATFYDDPTLWPIYARAQALAMPINFHCGILGRLHNSDGHHTSARYQRPICLDAVAYSFPDLKIIMPHLGFPWVEEACAIIASWPNIYWDLTGSSLLRIEIAWLREQFLRQGQDVWQKMLARLLWASDTHPPQTLVDRYEQIFDAMSVTDQQKQSVYWGTAAELFGLP